MRGDIDHLNIKFVSHSRTLLNYAFGLTSVKFLHYVVASWAAMLPATASMGSSVRKRPTIIARPSVVLKNGVLAFSPAKAEPLLAVAEA